MVKMLLHVVRGRKILAVKVFTLICLLCHRLLFLFTLWIAMASFHLISVKHCSVPVVVNIILPPLLWTLFRPHWCEHCSAPIVVKIVLSPVLWTLFCSHCCEHCSAPIVVNFVPSQLLWTLFCPHCCEHCSAPIVVNYGAKVFKVYNIFNFSLTTVTFG